MGKLEATNYRPVSLTSVVCKVMERIIKSAIVVHSERYQLVTPSQHGFVERKSCVTNLLETVDFVSQSIEDGYPVDIAFLDFAKAFDSVPHRRLLVKLAGYGINGKLLDWCRAFLANRVQRVVMGDVCSEWSSVLSGVPQGSVLGPLFFVMYINDIADGMCSKIELFADDTKQMSVVENSHDADVFQDDLNRLSNWSSWLSLMK